MAAPGAAAAVVVVVVVVVVFVVVIVVNRVVATRSGASLEGFGTRAVRSAESLHIQPQAHSEPPLIGRVVSDRAKHGKLSAHLKQNGSQLFQVPHPQIAITKP